VAAAARIAFVPDAKRYREIDGKGRQVRQK
jgi:hypothetical protein